MHEQCYVKIKYNFDDIILSLLEELDYANNNNLFYGSRNNHSRYDFSKNTRNYFKELLPINFKDCGIMRNIEKSFYPWHIDTERQCSINMLLCDNIEEYKTIFKINNNFIVVDYKKHIPILFNTKILHCVKNSSASKIRYLLSIGIYDISYSAALDLLT